MFFKINNSCAKLLSILLHMKYKLSQKPQLKKFIYLIAYDSSPIWVHTEIIYKSVKTEIGFPGSSADIESACKAGDPGLIPGLGRYPGRGHGNPYQYSGLENPHGQRSLEGYSPWGCRVRHDWATERLSISPRWKWLRYC